MKKSTKFIILITTALIVIIGALLILQKYLNTTTSDAVKFKNEYEDLNGQTNSNNKKYTEVNISKNNPIIYADYDKIFEILDSSGVIYFGFPECPWCRNAVPVLLEAANELNLDAIYYLNNLDDRDVKSLDEEDNVITTQESSANYKKLLTKLGEYSSEYAGLNDTSIRRLYFPTVIFVKEGKIIDAIVGTVDAQEDPYIALTSEQREELKNLYKTNITEVQNCKKGC